MNNIYTSNVNYPDIQKDTTTYITISNDALFSAFYFSELFIVGNTQEDNVLSPIIGYYPVFAAFLKRIIKYYSVPCRQNL